MRDLCILFTVLAPNSRLALLQQTLLDELLSGGFRRWTGGQAGRGWWLVKTVVLITKRPVLYRSGLRHS